MRGYRVVHGDKVLEEKLGRNDLCPCGSGRRFKRCCLGSGAFDGAERNDFFQGVSTSGTASALRARALWRTTTGPLRASPCRCDDPTVRAPLARGSGIGAY